MYCELSVLEENKGTGKQNFTLTHQIQLLFLSYRCSHLKQKLFELDHFSLVSKEGVQEHIAVFFLSCLHAAIHERYFCHLLFLSLQSPPFQFTCQSARPKNTCVLSLVWDIPQSDQVLETRSKPNIYLNCSHKNSSLVVIIRTQTHQ